VPSEALSRANSPDENRRRSFLRIKTRFSLLKR
jgi:hypothetical protein